MRIGEWMRRLESELDDIEVYTAADLASAQSEHRRDAVYVMYSSDDARPSDVAGQVRQQHTVGVDVVSAIRNFRGSRGSEAVDEIERVRDQVLDALVGWTPPSAEGEAIEYRRGRLLGFQDKAIWWQDSFGIFEYRTSTVTP